MTTTSHAGRAERLPTPRRLPFLVIVGVWMLFALWQAQMNVLLPIATGREPLPWSRVAENALVFAWFWALLTPVLMWITRRLRDRITSRVRRIAAHAAVFVVVQPLDVAVWSTMSAILGNPTSPFVELLFGWAPFNALTYGIIAVATTALDYHDAFRERGLRAAQLEAQLALAQFQALRAQLQPHFLFNSLNTISALMHKDVARADRMLARLGELLRIAIDSSGTPEIKLIDEIEFVRRYLDIEQVRFGDRLDVRVELPADAHDALVPTMLLQPIVENAVRHGVAPHSGRGRVEIRVQRHGPQLGIVVRDTGKGLDADALRDGQHAGVGLRTTRARLETLYGNAHELALVNVPGGGFETRVKLPFHSLEEAR